MKIAKYFWDFNNKALKETDSILKNPEHKEFASRVVRILSRCDDPKELFSIFSKKSFISFWPKVRAYWKKAGGDAVFIDWWQTIYEELLRQNNQTARGPREISSSYFSKIGRQVKDARNRIGLSQKDLALRAGIKQPDISKIEEGKINVTLKTLLALTRALGIKSIDTA